MKSKVSFIFWFNVAAFFLSIVLWLDSELSAAFLVCINVWLATDYVLTELSKKDGA